MRLQVSGLARYIKSTRPKARDSKPSSCTGTSSLPCNFWKHLGLSCRDPARETVLDSRRLHARTPGRLATATVPGGKIPPVLFLGTSRGTVLAVHMSDTELDTKDPRPFSSLHDSGFLCFSLTTTQQPDPPDREFHATPTEPTEPRAMRMPHFSAAATACVSSSKF